MKTVYDIMDRTEKSLIKFDQACEEAAVSKFIVAEKRISSVLQCIAGSSILYEFISECLNGFDFKKETASLMRTIDGRLKLAIDVLPRRKRIAYVFSLFYSFDSRQNELLKFIQKYYSSNNVNLEYSEFCKEILLPFKYDIFNELAESDQ